jgi:beta-lactamase class D
MRVPRIFFTTLLAFGAFVFTEGGCAAVPVVLESDAAGKLIVSGDAKLVDVPLPPASTFKIVITLAGLEAGIVEPTTVYSCYDDHLTPKAQKLTLAEAMRQSSNDYFLKLADKLGYGKVKDRASSSGFFMGPLPANWPGSGDNAIERGGDEKVSPRHMLGFIYSLMDGGVVKDPAVLAKVKAAMVWPVEGAAYPVYAKTGTNGGAVWCVGWTEGPKGKRRVVVAAGTYLQGGDWKPARETVIKAFETAVKQPFPKTD